MALLLVMWVLVLLFYGISGIYVGSGISMLKNRMLGYSRNHSRLPLCSGI